MKSIIAASLFFAFFLGLSGFIFHHEVFREKTHVSDIPFHITMAERFNEPGHKIPHPMFHFLVYYGTKWTHLKPEIIAVGVCSLFSAAYAALIALTLGMGLQQHFSLPVVLLMTAVLLLVSAIYLPFFNKYIYLGQGSPNVWHNPTLLMARPFVIGGMLLTAKFFEKPQWQSRPSMYLLLGGLFWLSLLAKPNFVMAFLPAVFLFVLLKPPPRREAWLKAAAIFAPAAVYLGRQYLVVFTDPHGPPTAEHDRIIFDFCGVMRFYTPNVFVSLLLAMAFPIALTLCRVRRLPHNNLLLLAWLMMLVALAEGGLLAEEIKYVHGNFLWGYMMALSALFVFSGEEMLRWMTEPDGLRGRRNIRLFAGCAGVLGLHLVSGIYHLGRIMLGYGYY